MRNCLTPSNLYVYAWCTCADGISSAWWRPLTAQRGEKHWIFAFITGIFISDEIEWEEEEKNVYFEWTQDLRIITLIASHKFKQFVITNSVRLNLDASQIRGNLHWVVQILRKQNSLRTKRGWPFAWSFKSKIKPFQVNEFFSLEDIFSHFWLMWVACVHSPQNRHAEKITSTTIDGSDKIYFNLNINI